MADTTKMTDEDWSDFIDHRILLCTKMTKESWNPEQLHKERKVDLELSKELYKLKLTELSMIFNECVKRYDDRIKYVDENYD